MPLAGLGKSLQNEVIRFQHVRKVKPDPLVEGLKTSAAFVQAAGRGAHVTDMPRGNPPGMSCFLCSLLQTVEHFAFEKGRTRGGGTGRMV